MNQQVQFTPFREPMRSTVLRTFSIALAPALVTCLVTHKTSAFAPLFFGVLWFSLGGHFAELLWLEVIRYRLPRSSFIQKIGRISFWFVSGMILGVPMSLTMHRLDPRINPPNLLIIGFAYVLIELAVHYVLLHRSGKASFYNSAG